MGREVLHVMSTLWAGVVDPQHLQSPYGLLLLLPSQTIQLDLDHAAGGERYTGSITADMGIHFFES